jgi:hypothetical protein
MVVGNTGEKRNFAQCYWGTFFELREESKKTRYSAARKGSETNWLAVAGNDGL